MAEQRFIVCRDGCKTEADVTHLSDDDKIIEAMRAAGWVHLAVQNRWRCPTCDAALLAVAHINGADPDPNFVDAVPKDSRGALPKNTADGITRPSVPA